MQTPTLRCGVTSNRGVGGALTLLLGFVALPSCGLTAPGDAQGDAAADPMDARPALVDGSNGSDGSAGNDVGAGSDVGSAFDSAPKPDATIDGATGGDSGPFTCTPRPTWADDCANGIPCKSSIGDPGKCLDRHTECLVCSGVACCIVGDTTVKCITDPAQCVGD